MIQGASDGPHCFGIPSRYLEQKMAEAGALILQLVMPLYVFCGS